MKLYSLYNEILDWTSKGRTTPGSLIFTWSEDIDINTQISCYTDTSKKYSYFRIILS